MANEYYALSQMKKTLALQGETFANADISEALEAASRCIDVYKKTKFYLGEEAARYFTPVAGSRAMKIDDLASLTSVEIDADGDGTYEESWDLDTQFYLDPPNAALDEQPWTRICLLDRVG